MELLDFLSNDKPLHQISINGKTIKVRGNNVTIRNGEVRVDGELVMGELTGNVHVKWEGPLANLDCGGLDVTGDINGNVSCGSLKVGGSITAEKISAGNVTSNGPITVHKISAGNVQGVTKI